VRELCSCEEAWYKALTLEVHHHTFAKWIPLFDMNYTYGSAVDEDTNERSTSSSFLYDPKNPALSKGPSDNDIRHRFSANATYRLPWYGFEVSAIFQARTGLPYNGGIAFTGTGTTATSLSGMSQTSGNIPVFVDSKGSIIDLVALGSLSRQAFSDALKAVGGHMIGRNAFRQPGWHNLDMRVTKNFDFAHGANKYQVQLIGEAFNLLNTINPFVSSTRQDRFRATYNQSTNIYTFAALPDFGVPNSYATVPDPRQAQVAVKFIF